MRFLLLLFVTLVAAPIFANTEIRTQIHDIDMGLPGEEPLIFLTSGQVVKYPSANKLTLDILKEAIQKKTWFLIRINEEREIIDFHEVPAALLNTLRPTNLKLKLFSVDPSYRPSILKDLEQARKYFYESRTDHHKESQCYNRAHVWTYEWRKKKNLYSSKVWLFFTRKFIRKYKFEWWFHVSPMVNVVVDNEVKERVMDMKYARGPLKLKQWTDIFMRDNADCPVVQKYSDHANYPESGSCFVMKSSMYYYQPVDLEEEELSGNVRNRWVPAEVNHAYQEAFSPNTEVIHE